MSDLIYRKDAIRETWKEPTYSDPLNVLTEMRDRLEALPSREPEIVRCKDCKFSEHWYRDRRRCFLWVEDGISVFDDGFCNYAERKEDG